MSKPLENILSPPPSVTLTSRGRCLVVGGAQAVTVAEALASHLHVTLLLSEPVPPPDLPCMAGTVRGARGSFGAFEIDVLSPGNESAARTIEADILVDLTGARSLFTGCGERDGYLRARPTDTDGIGRIVTAAAALVGEFVKPLHVTLTPELCAHARNRRTGCARCLDLCPAGAIEPRGDHVHVDHRICEGCGSCAGSCPTGALTATMPPPTGLLASARRLLPASLIVLHEAGEGSELAHAVVGSLPESNGARLLEVGSVLQLGHDVLLGLIAAGASRVGIVVPPRHRDHLAGLESQLGVAEAILSGLGSASGRYVVLEESDPDIASEIIMASPPPSRVEVQSFGTVGSKREVAANIVAALHSTAPAAPAVIALPRGAPYGTVVLDHGRCTLCLACVGSCPTHALQDNRERPELRFDEAACVQCGLCVATCPEQALALQPRLDLTAARGALRTLKAEEPCVCRACGKPFGTRSAIARVKHRLAGNPHFAEPGRLDLVEMCGDCRVGAYMKGQREPLAYGPRPRVRTSEDYMRQGNAQGDARGGSDTQGPSPARKAKPSDPTVA